MRADDPPSLSELERRAFAAAVEKVAPSVVSIETVGGLERVEDVLVGTGPTTGLIVSADGYIVSSAFNFAQKPSSILVGLPDGTRTPARLVSTDRNRRLVLLKVDVEERMPVPQAAPVEELRVGQWTVAVGRTFSAAEPNVSVGIISALNRIWTKAVQTDAKVSPANYGGPLVDVRGRVIGVLVPLAPSAAGDAAGVEWYDSGIGFAIPLADIERLLPRMQEGHDLLPGIIGVTLKAGELYGEIPEITAARPNSPAAKAGLKAGDQIIEIDGTPIRERHDLMREVNRRYAGDTLHLVAMRKDERLERDITLIDKLDPYRRPFLGLLPLRDAGETVVVRYVYPDSPAAKAGLETGDQIVALDGTDVKDIAELTIRVAGLEIGKPVALDVRRGDKPTSLKIAPSTVPETVPDQLPPATHAAAAPPDDRPAVGVVEMSIPEFSNECLAYVPEKYDPARRYGLLVWLHGPGGFENDALMERWRTLCDRDDFILLAPKSLDPARWTAPEAEFIAKLVGQMQADYSIDPLRVALYGYQSGAALGYATAFKDREKIRGVAAVNTPFNARPPENDPEFRLDLYIVTSDELDLSKPLEAVRKMQHTVVERKQGERGRNLDDDELAELLRWFDALDKQ